MKLAVTGGRDYRITREDLVFLEHLVSTLPVSEILSGGARGVDSAVEQWARVSGFSIRRFYPNWSKGKGAGFANNLEMASQANALAAFPGGAGTNHMVSVCRELGMPIFESPSRLNLNQSSPISSHE